METNAISGERPAVILQRNVDSDMFQRVKEQTWNESRQNMVENCECPRHQVIKNVTYIKKNPLLMTATKEMGLTMKQNLLNYKIVR